MKDDWNTLPLEDCMAAIIDYRGKTPTKTTYGIPLVTAKVIKGGRIETPDEFIAESDYEDWMRRGMPKRGDIVMTTEAPLGEIAQLDGSKIALAQRVITLRGKPNLLDNTFLKFLMQSSAVQEELRARATGSTVLGIRQSELRKVELTLPPLAEQKRIAHILGTLDDKIEVNRRMNATLEAMARALFQSWFVDFDPVRRNAEGATQRPEDALFPDSFEDSKMGEIPKGWIPTTLGTEVDFLTGFAFKSKSFVADSDVRLARGDNVKEGFFHWDSKARYWPEITPDMERYSLQVGDVLIGMDGSKVGKNWVRVRRCDLPCLLVQRVASLREKNSIGQHYLWILVSDARFRNFVDAVKTGTSIPHISGGQIKAFDLVRPPVGENLVFKHFEEIVGPIGEQIDANIEQSQTLTALRDALLPQFLSGEFSIT